MPGVVSGTSASSGARACSPMTRLSRGTLKFGSCVGLDPLGGLGWCEQTWKGWARWESSLPALFRPTEAVLVPSCPGGSEGLVDRRDRQLVADCLLGGPMITSACRFDARVRMDVLAWPI